MHAHDQHLLIVGAVEDADPAPLRKARVVRHRKSCSQFLGARMLEAEHLAALRVDAGHDVLDGAVLAGRIHGLEDQQHRVAVGRVQQAPGRRSVARCACEHALVFLLRVVDALDPRGPFLEVHFLARRHPEITRMYLHGANFPVAPFPTGRPAHCWLRRSGCHKYPPALTRGHRVPGQRQAARQAADVAAVSHDLRRRTVLHRAVAQVRVPRATGEITNRRLHRIRACVPQHWARLRTAPEPKSHANAQFQCKQGAFFRNQRVFETGRNNF